VVHFGRREKVVVHFGRREKEESDGTPPKKWILLLLSFFL
jgi:hypothetical protein